MCSYSIGCFKTLLLLLLLCVHAQVLRGGESLEYDLQLDPLQTLVPVHKYDQLPSYFIYAGEQSDGCLLCGRSLYACTIFVDVSVCASTTSCPATSSTQVSSPMGVCCAAAHFMLVQSLLMFRYVQVRPAAQLLHLRRWAAQNLQH
jgi:hypothetical protein